MRCKSLGTKPKQEERRDNSLNFLTKLNSLKLLPHWHRLPKWAKSLEGQYKLCSSINYVFLKTESGMQYIYPTVNTWRKTNYIEAQRLQKNDMPQRHNKGRKTRNQAIKGYQLNQAIKRYQLTQLDQ